jgi:ABC-type dipeptide/oligopeptide/nickel transport system ATPase subunit
MRKFELVEGSFQEQGASKWRTWWSRWGYYKRFGVLKGWKLLKLREALTRAFLDVQSVNPMLKTSLVGVPWVEIQATDGGLEVKIERLPGMDEDEKLAELVSVSTRKDWEAFEVVDFWREPGATYSIFLLEDVATDKKLELEKMNNYSYTKFCINIQKGLEVDFERSPGLGLFGRSGSGKTTTLLAFLFQFLRNGAQICLIDGKNELQILDNLVNRAFKLDNIIKLLEIAVNELERREALLSKASAQSGRLGLRASEIALNPLVIAVDELGAVMASADSKDRAKIVALLTQIALKGRSCGVVLVVSSQFASVETIPNAIRSQLSTKILLGSAPAELVRMVFPQSSGGAKSARQFEGFVFVEGQRGREPARFQVPALGCFKDVSKWVEFMGG